MTTAIVDDDNDGFRLVESQVAPDTAPLVLWLNGAHFTYFVCIAASNNR